MIYFMQSVDGGPVKIGHSEDVDRRREQLESHYGRPLALLGTMPGGRDEERALHERFAEHRIGRTEQFRPAPDLMAFIGRPLLVGANPDAVEAMESAPASQGVAVAIKGSPEWKEWVERLADHCRCDVSALVDQALTEHARRNGFAEVPPRRRDAGGAR